MSAVTVTPPPQPTTAPMTAEEFGLKYAGQNVEFVDGQVKEVSMSGGSRHGKICNWVAYHLTSHAGRLGHIFINDTFLRVPTPRDAERVYGPDVFYVSFERLPQHGEVPVGVMPLTPELVFEVKSPSDTWNQVFVKVGEYLAVGVTLVVVLDAPTRTATVYADSFGQRTHGPEDELTLPEVLPGFAVRVADFFA